MPNRASLMLFTVTYLGAAAALAAAAASDTPGAAPPPAAQLIESLGLHVAPTPVRERSGWHRPRVILVNGSLHELLPQLRQASRRARPVRLSRKTTGRRGSPTASRAMVARREE